MKLRDLYEGYELKRGEDVKKDNNTDLLFYDIGEYQVVDVGPNPKKGIIHLKISNDIKKNIYLEYGYKPKSVVGHDNIVKLVEMNLDMFSMYEDRQKIINTFLDIPNFGGYTGWKILDNNFKVSDRDIMQKLKDVKSVMLNINKELYFKEGHGYINKCSSYSIFFGVESVVHITENDEEFNYNLNSMLYTSCYYRRK